MSKKGKIKFEAQFERSSSNLLFRIWYRTLTRFWFELRVCCHYILNPSRMCYLLLFAIYTNIQYTFKLKHLNYWNSRNTYMYNTQG